MKYINLTPHELVQYNPDECRVEILGGKKTFYLTEGQKPEGTYPSSGLARATEKKVTDDHLESFGRQVEVHNNTYGEAVGLPEPQNGTMYIVSVQTAKAALYRNDLLVVDDTVRNEEGRIVGYTSFAHIKQP